MALTTRITCVMLVLAVAYPRNSYTVITSEPQQISKNIFQSQTAIGANAENEENLQKLLDLQSIFGTDWKKENKPLNKDQLNFILKDVFGINVERGVEFGTQNYFKPNLDDYKTILGSQFVANNKNKELSDPNFNQNNKITWQENQKTSNGVYDYGQNFDSQTVFPIKTFITESLGVVPTSSSYSSDVQDKNNIHESTSMSKPTTRTGVYATTTQSYWYDNQGNSYPNGNWFSMKNDVNPTNPSFKLADNNGIRPTSPSLVPENHTEPKPNIPSYWFGIQHGVNPDGTRFRTEDQKNINSTYQNFSLINQSSTIPTTVLTNPNPSKRSDISIPSILLPGQEDSTIKNIPSNGYRFHNGIHSFSQHIRHFDVDSGDTISPGNQDGVVGTYRNIRPGEHIYAGLTNMPFMHGYHNNGQHTSSNFRRRGYHYHRCTGCERHLYRDYHTKPPNSKGSTSETDYGDKIDIRFGVDDKENLNNSNKSSVNHKHSYGHHRYPHYRHHHHGHHHYPDVHNYGRSF